MATDTEERGSKSKWLVVGCGFWAEILRGESRATVAVMEGFEGKSVDPINIPAQHIWFLNAAFPGFFGCHGVLIEATRSSREPVPASDGAHLL